MKQHVLSLRQRKILHFLMNQKTIITGKDLAKELGVTDRTVRSDILEINQYISHCNAGILSVKSKGYYFQADDPGRVFDLTRGQLGLLSREDRTRYLAFKLCLSDEPVNIYELEEEMYASHSTLEQDLKLLRKMFVYSYPFIKMVQLNNELFFEQDEKKIRTILARLAHDDWNYHIRGNAFYNYHFLKEDILNLIMDHVPEYLSKYSIHMDDPSLVYLEIMLAVGYQRMQDGHTLSEEILLTEPVSKAEKEAHLACVDIFRMLEKELGCCFPESEKQTVYKQILMSRLPDMSCINIENLSDFTGKEIIRIADLYISRINDIFRLDLSCDEDFYITLCLTIRTLHNEAYIYNTQGNHSMEIERMPDEYEFAVLFQEIALEYLGRFLTEIELINLAYCISGAMLYLFNAHPEWKLRTVICIHRSMVNLWYLKRKILAEYGTFLNVSELIPVNSIMKFDFHSTDLVLTTDKRVSRISDKTETLYINSNLTQEDSDEISAFIARKKFERLCPLNQDECRNLINNAVWHEKELRKSKSEIINILADDISDDSEYKKKIIHDILTRENITSFATGRSIVFLHSIIPSEQTRLSIMTLDHRIIWNTYKIRIIILGVFRTSDFPMMLQLKHLFYEKDREAMRMLKTKSEVCGFFL